MTIARSRVLLTIAVAVGLSACRPSGTDTPSAAVAPPTSTTSATGVSESIATADPSQPFAANPWYLPFADVKVAIGTPDFTYGQEIAAEIVHYYGHAALNTYSFSPALYVVGPSQPVVPVAMWNCQHKASLDQGFINQMSAVPIPADAVIPTDTDAHVVVWQPSQDTVWEMWKARRTNGQWEACWGGRLQHASLSTGTFPLPYGATATGISVLAGLITVKDIQRGHIDHAISIAVVKTRKGQHSWPANRSDGYSTDPTSIPEGQRLRLDPAIDLSQLKLTPLGHMIAEAMQRYGVIVRDTAGSVAVYAENATPYTTNGGADPYAALYGGKPKWAQLDAIPWSRLQTIS